MYNFIQQECNFDKKIIDSKIINKYNKHSTTTMYSLSMLFKPYLVFS